MRSAIVIDMDSFQAYRAASRIKAKKVIQKAGLTKALLVVASAESLDRQLTPGECREVWEANLKEPCPSLESFISDETVIYDLFDQLEKKPRLTQFTKGNYKRC